jgi:hypothetical protein
MLPEASKEGFQASDTVYAVTAVTRRFVGRVGGVRSRAADAGDTLRTRANTTIRRDLMPALTI